MGRHHRLLAVAYLNQGVTVPIRYGARVTQVEGKEQRNKETEKCDVVGAPGAIRCKKLR